MYILPLVATHAVTYFQFRINLLLHFSCNQPISMPWLHFTLNEGHRSFTQLSWVAWTAVNVWKTNIPHQSLAPDKSVLHSRQIAAVWNASSTKLKLSKNRVKSLYSLVKFQEGLVKFIEFYKFTKFRPDPNLWWTCPRSSQASSETGSQEENKKQESIYQLPCWTLCTLVFIYLTYNTWLHTQTQLVVV